MATKNKEVKQEIVVAPKKELVLEGDPQAQLEFAMKAANALMTAVAQKKNKVMIRGEQYLEYGDWQTLARFFGATAGVAWSKKLTDEKGAFIGYEARAEVLHNGVVISSAEAMCMKAERNWAQRDEFMLRSMAQTRASSKALRNAYGWVAELAGMKSTPAEEMDGVAGYDHSPIKATAIPVVSYDDHEAEPPRKSHNPVADFIDKNKVKQDELKRKIKDICDKTVLVPLLSKTDYEEYVEGNTGLDLKDQSLTNLETIIERLEALNIAE